MSVRRSGWIGVLAFVVVAALARAATAQEASFDCDRASVPVEYLICGDAELERLDAALAKAYTAKRDSLAGPARDALQAEQRQWLDSRLKQCGIPVRGDLPPTEQRWTQAPCLADRYRERLTALGAPQPPAPASATLPAGVLHPLCLLDVLEPVYGDSEAEPVALPLDRCQAGYRHVPVNRDADGRLSATTAAGGWENWFSYQPIGALADGRQVAVTYYNGGGSGVFSSIVAIKRAPGAKGETMVSVEVLIEGGDRCSGGIRHASVVDGSTIEYTQHATQADFIASADEAIPDTAVEDLPMCMACCYATLTYRERVGDPPQLASATLDPPSADAPPSPPSAAASCLAQVIGKSTAFSADELKAAATQFLARCVKAK